MDMGYSLAFESDGVILISYTTISDSLSLYDVMLVAVEGGSVDSLIHLHILKSTLRGRAD